MNISKLGAYTIEKKDVLIILHNEPLLFVQGPPIFIKVVVEQEESTSVFVLNGEELKGGSEVTLEQTQIHENENKQDQKESPEGVNPMIVTDPSLVRRITYLGSPFARQVYRPLEFILGDEILKGTIEKIDGETVMIEMSEGDKEFVSVEMGKIEEILWRGDPFVED